MLRISAYSLLGASALALGGCTIYTSPRPATYQAPRPAARRAPTTTPRGTVIVSRPTATAPDAATPTPNGTPTVGGGIRGPRITSPILFGNGQSGAFTGEAFVIPTSTQRLPNLSELVPFATLYTNSFDIKPQTFSGGFPGALRQDEWFAIRYEGDFMIDADGTAELALTSDDGAVLTIDGVKVLDNDGAHAASTVTVKRSMRQGAHHLRLDYFQAARGLVALELDIVAPGQKSSLGGLRPLQGVNRTAPR